LTADAIPAGELCFVICIEANQLEVQGRLLCESIRRFAGRYAASRIVAVSPRPELAIGEDIARRLREMEVEHVSLPLNLTGSPYGPINRIVAGQWAEQSLTTPFLAVLDTDTLFVSEPEFTAEDVGVRPVDVKGSATAGPEDAFDAYWARMAERAGLVLDDLPWIETSVSGQRIRASYNGGFAVVRREIGVLGETARVFLRSFAADDRPRKGRGDDIRASTGSTGLDAAEWWGSSQAALAAAIWSKTADVRIYDAAYNIPLHMIARKPELAWPLKGRRPVLLHYHYLLEPELRAQLAAALDRIGCPAAAADWLKLRLTEFGAEA
jgi:hypothetical protein